MTKYFFACAMLFIAHNHLCATEEENVPTMQQILQAQPPSIQQERQELKKWGHTIDKMMVRYRRKQEAAGLWNKKDACRKLFEN